MLDKPVIRWIVAVIVVLALVAMLAWARNDPGVGGRQDEAPSSAPATAVIRSVF